jgi:hypothetical protein
MMVVDYSATGDAFLAQPPRGPLTVPTIEDVNHTTYDVTADGKRFAALVPQESDETPSRELHVVLNRFEESKRLVPAD